MGKLKTKKRVSSLKSKKIDPRSSKISRPNIITVSFFDKDSSRSYNATLFLNKDLLRSFNEVESEVPFHRYYVEIVPYNELSDAEWDYIESAGLEMVVVL
jgi:hypothetical protein